MAFYVPKHVPSLVGGNDDPFNEPFQRLLKQRTTYKRWRYASMALFTIGYPLGFYFLYLANPSGFLSPGTAGWNQTIVTIAIIFFGIVVIGTSFLAAKAGKLKLPKEHLAFLEVYLAKKDLEDYAQHPEGTAKLVHARFRLGNVLLLVPYGRKDSLITSSALKEVSEFRNFVKERLIPYLSPPLETPRAIDALGYMAQFLLNPTMDGLPFIMTQLNISLPESALHPRKPFGSEGLKTIRLLLTRTYTRIGWVGEAFAAFLVGAIIYAIAVLGLGAPPYDGFLGGSASVLAAFFGIRYELERRSNANE